MNINLGDACICCGNEDNFRWYENNSGDLCGKYCYDCNAEWLPQRYVESNEDDESEDILDASPPYWHGELLHLSTPIKLEANTAFQIQAPRTKIDPSDVSDIKPGDHITWHRLHGMWHHAIVDDVHIEEKQIRVIEWTLKRQWTPEIMRHNLTTRNGVIFNQMYRIEYPKGITDLYDPELVLARARSRVGDTGYQPFMDNCETFATYCKTGFPQSHQVAWLNAKLNEYVNETAVVTTKTFVKGMCDVGAKVAGVVDELPHEIFEAVSTGCKGVAAGIVVALESGYVMWDLSSAYEQYKKEGNISRDDYIEKVLSRLIEGLLTAGFALAGSIGVQFAIGSLATVPFGTLGLVVCGITSGIICGAVGKLIGIWLGNIAGKVAALPFEDDVAVRDIRDLEAGDHIVLYGWCLHPRCHAICIGHDGNKQIKVIRNTYNKGVVEEIVPFDDNILKVIYTKDSCLDSEKVVQNARSKLGDHNYNIVTYNCQSFAQECKTTLMGVAFEPDLEGVMLDKSIKF